MTTASTMGSPVRAQEPAQPPLRPLPDAPSFSVIVAAHNAEETVVAAVESALAQTAPPLEIVVVDDGSSDGTAEALGPLADRIALHRTENRGPAAARNEAARLATGDFLAILDADDVFLPTRLEALSRLAVARPELDLLLTNVVYEGAGRSRPAFGPHRPFPVGDQRRAILTGNFVQFPAVRAARFREHGGFDERFVVAEDWELWARMILAGSRAGLVDEPLLRYRRHAQSLTGDGERLLRGKLAFYRAMLARDELADDELGIVLAGAEQCLAGLRVVAARAALRAGSTDARRLALAVARDSKQRATLRLKALLAAAAPSVARAIASGADGKDAAADGAIDDPEGASS